MFPDCSGAATGDGVNDFAGRDETSSSELEVELGIKVNLHTPRCTCEGNVSRDWYGEHVWSLHGEMRCRILRRLQDEAFCTAVLILFSPRCICEGNVSRDWYGEHVSRLFRCCRVVAGSGAFTTIWALMVMGGYGPV